MKKTFFLFALAFCSIILNAQQKLTIDQVYSVELRNTGSIYEGEQIKGYYFFYRTDKIDRKTNEYTLQLLDANLNKVKNIIFADTKEIVLLESSFNSTSFMFTLYDYRQGEFIFKIYGTDGLEKKSIVNKLNPATKAYLDQVMAMQTEDAKMRFVTDVKNKGFISMIPHRKKMMSSAFGFELSFYSSEGEKKWSWMTDDSKPSSLAFIGQQGSVGLFLMSTLNKTGSALSGGFDMDFSIVGIDLNAGKELFETKADNNGFKMLPANVGRTSNPNEFVVTGPYYKQNDQVWNSQSQGIGFMILDEKGKVKSVKNNSWKEQIGKLLPVDQKGRIENIGYMMIHDLISTGDGKTFVIGEGYAHQKTKVSVTDLVLLQFNDKFEIEKIITNPKTNTNTQEYKMGLLGGNPHEAAMMMRYKGLFDYSFSQTTKNNSSFIVGYTDYDKSKENKNIVFHSVTYLDNKTSNDRIDLQSEATVFKILPGKTGSILIMEYHKKAKRLDLRLEKIN